MKIIPRPGTTASLKSLSHLSLPLDTRILWYDIIMVNGKYSTIETYLIHYYTDNISTYDGY